MAKSKFEYVRQFEREDICLPNTWIVVRVDGKAFHRFSDVHKFAKPNDDRSLGLMTKSAISVMQEFKDIIMAYGQSDEYSFVFRKKTTTYNRRASKLMTNIVSLFAASYVYCWKDYFGDDPLQYPPAFDGRVVLYPSEENIRDYLSWRQADCHINNLYNTCFWNLVQKKKFTTHEAEEKLKGTVSADKNELLFSEFGINYNDLPELYRKGTTLIREKIEDNVTKEVEDGSGEKKVKVSCRQRPHIVALNVDIIGNEFWTKHPNILEKTTR